jgi:hypothetical protein
MSGSVGLRALLWLVVGLLLVFVLFQLYRAYRLGRGGAAVPGAPAAGETAPARGEAFQVELEVQQLRREVGELRAALAEQRRELGEQRRELSELGAGMQAQKEQLESTTASQGVSPEYNEALVYARRGLGVEAIAERCGITVAEAELVCSLARRGEGEAGGGA